MNPQNLKLFDNIERAYLGPSKHSESSWQYLNRTARPEYEYLRDLLQSWFDDYETSPEKRKRLWKEFRNENEPKHLSAFFELYLYHLFKKQNFTIEIEPEWEKGNPDFLLTTPEGEKILLEATGVYPEEWFGYKKQQESKVIDYLNENLDSPDYFLHINIHDSPNNVPPYARICKYLQQKIAELDYSQVVQAALERDGMGLGRFNPIVWKHEIWSIEFRVIPKKNEARGKSGVRPIGSMSYGVTTGTSSDGIKSAIERKYGHYGDLEIPYILALNVVDTYVNDESIVEALFGQEVVHLNWDAEETGEAKVSRKPNGSWSSHSGYQKRRMSGIYIFKRLRPWNAHLVNPTFWHHPYPNFPIDPARIIGLQHIPISGHYETRDGKHPNDFLKIDTSRMPS